MFYEIEREKIGSLQKKILGLKLLTIAGNV